MDGSISLKDLVAVYKQAVEELEAEIEELNIENDVLWDYVLDHPAGDDIADQILEDIKRVKNGNE